MCPIFYFNGDLKKKTNSKKSFQGLFYLNTDGNGMLSFWVIFGKNNGAFTWPEPHCNPKI